MLRRETVPSGQLDLGVNASAHEHVPAALPASTRAALPTDEIDHSQPGCCDAHAHEHAPETFHVRGLVTNPGRYALPKNTELHVLDAVAMAGGTRNQWADKAHVIRQMPGGQPVTIPISIKKARQEGKGNIALNAGDVVSVDSNLATGFITDIPGVITDSVGRMVDLFR